MICSAIDYRKAPTTDQSNQGNELELLKIIYGAAIGQGLLIIVLLLTSTKANMKANLFLLALVVLMLKAILVGYAGLNGWNVTWIRQPSVYLLFAHGPIVYCYCLFMTNRQPPGLRFLLHFAWLLFPFIWFQLKMYRSDFGLNVLFLTSFLQLTGYYILAIWQVYRYSETIKLNFSNTEKYKLRWLFVLISSLGALMVIDLGLALIGRFLFSDATALQIPHLSVVETCYVFGIGVFAAKQPSIIFDQPMVETTRKYDRSGLNHQKAEELGREIDALLIREKLYLDSEFSLTQLSQKLNVSPVHVSQVLNENMETSFYDLINQLRIEESKRLLELSLVDKKSVLEIAFESGFNNKTSFNNAFKKYTGVTPSIFKKKLQLNSDF